MSELQDMLRVQARLHRKQGANALGDLFQSAALEIEILTERLENPQGLQELICVEQMKEISLPEIHRANQKLHEQLAKANERIEELQDALVDDAKAKTMLNKLAMENGELNIKASGNIFHVFCETFVETFKTAGATNYLVAEFNSEELGAFTVTMQRSEGLTVYQKLNEANERVKELEEQLQLTILTTHEAAFESDYGKKRLYNFSIKEKLEILNEFKKECGIILPAHKLQDKIEQLRKEQENG